MPQVAKKVFYWLSLFFCAAEIFAFTWFGFDTAIWIKMGLPALAWLSFLFLALSGEQIEWKNPIFICGLFMCLYIYIGTNNFAQEAVRNSPTSSFLRPLRCIEWLPISIKASIYDGDAYSALLRCAAITLISGVFGTLFRNGNTRKFLMYFFAANVACMSLYAIAAKFLGIKSIYNAFYFSFPVYGSFPNENIAGAFLTLGLSVSLGLLFSLKNKYIKISLLLFCAATAAAIFYNESIAGRILCVCVIALAGAAICAKRYGARGLLALSALAAILMPLLIMAAGKSIPYGEILASIESRKEIYAMLAKEYKNAPVFGVGGDCLRYSIAYPYYQMQRKKAGNTVYALHHAHSSILQFLLEYGAVGASAIFLAVLLSMLAMKRGGNYRICVFAGVAATLAHSFFDIDTSNVCLCAAWCMAVISCRGEECGRAGRNGAFNFMPAVVLLCAAYFLWIIAGKYSSQEPLRMGSMRYSIAEAAAAGNLRGVFDAQYKRLKNTHFKGDMELLEKTFSDEAWNGRDKLPDAIFKAAFLKKIDKMECASVPQEAAGRFLKVSDGRTAAALYCAMAKHSPEGSAAYKNYLYMALNAAASAKFSCGQELEEIFLTAVSSGEAKIAAEALKHISNSPAKNLFVYRIAGSEKVSAYFENLSRTAKLSEIYPDVYRGIEYSKLVNRLFRQKRTSEIIRELHYTGAFFSMIYLPANISSLPLYAYVFGVLGETGEKNKYADMLVSKNTLGAVSCEYIAYVKVAALALSELGMVDRAMSLIGTLNNKSQKADALYYCVPSILKTRGGAEKLSEFLEKI